jgi:hypothetical protein
MMMISLLKRVRVRFTCKWLTLDMMVSVAALVEELL